ACLHIPQRQTIPIRGSRNENFTMASIDDGLCGCSFAGESLGVLATSYVPQLDTLIDTCRCQRLAVRTERQGVDVLCVPLQRRSLLETPCSLARRLCGFGPTLAIRLSRLGRFWSACGLFQFRTIGLALGIRLLRRFL